MVNYSEEELKIAFWKTFHKQGEVFFDYMEVIGVGVDDSAVTDYWQDFLKHLEG